MMRTPIKVFRQAAVAVAVCLILSIPLITPHAQRGTGPIAKEGLLKSLRNRVLSSRELIREVERRGVTFELSLADEQELRLAGKYLGQKGRDDLIAAIKRNYRADTTQQPTATPAAEVKAGQPEPNIIPVGYGKLHILYDPATQTFTEGDTGIPAVIARFRNAHERDREIADGKDIRAHIYFEPAEFYKNLDRSISGFAAVNDGIWLNEKNALINFARGETKTLILAIQMPDGGFGGFDAFEHSVRTVNGKELFLPRIPKLTADKYFVKVEIIGGVNGETAELYHFTITLRPELNISFG